LQIPMGTVVTATMLIGVVFAFRAPMGGLSRVAPAWLTKTVASILGAAGLWNVLWYGLQNLTDFWGHMALGSGVVMIAVSAIMLMSRESVPPILINLRPVLVLLLAGFGAYYAWTIYNL